MDEKDWVGLGWGWLLLVSVFWGWGLSWGFFKMLLIFYLFATVITIFLLT